jgi:hypothetical protein
MARWADDAESGYRMLRGDRALSVARAARFAASVSIADNTQLHNPGKPAKGPDLKVSGLLER